MHAVVFTVIGGTGGWHSVGVKSTRVRFCVPDTPHADAVHADHADHADTL